MNTIDISSLTAHVAVFAGGFARRALPAIPRETDLEKGLFEQVEAERMRYGQCI